MEEIDRIVKALNRKGAIKVLTLLAEKKELKFNDIARAVGYSSIAGRILKDLKKLGIVTKRNQKDNLGTVLYELTEKGRKLMGILVQMKGLY